MQCGNADKRSLLEVRQVEAAMKIYLLMLIIATLLIAVHFTALPGRSNETAPQ